MSTNVIHAEWIGKHARIIAAKNKSLEGLEGTVVDETRNTVTMETNRGIKRAQKHGTVFEIEGQEVQGDEILMAPEERIKLKAG
jgi:ribonuclease P protein subunit POP4